MTIFGALRVKSESRWINRVVRAMLPLCEHIWVFDDHSTDGTPEICESIGREITVHRSTFEGLDETRDRQWLLNAMMSAIPNQSWLDGRADSPYAALCLDGDEELVPGGQDVIRDFWDRPNVFAASLPIRYLWNSPNTVRVDGVYRFFNRPSTFRLCNRAFTYKTTPWGGNFHCSSIPQELLHHAHYLLPGADLLHYGYMLKEDRLRKFEWYSKIDPNNDGEGRYLHCIQGDVPEVPADAILKHAGPLELRNI